MLLAFLLSFFGGFFVGTVIIAVCNHRHSVSSMTTVKRIRSRKTSFVRYKDNLEGVVVVVVVDYHHYYQQSACNNIKKTEALQTETDLVVADADADAERPHSLRA
jgi:hypothetical protein